MYILRQKREHIMLQDKDLARLTNTLQVPLIVQDILDGNIALEADIRYGIHEIISEFHPDSALLCLALSARRVAVALQGRYRTMTALKMECDRLIAEYAPLWLDHAGHRAVNETLLFDTLLQIPDDLESLSELLEMDAVILKGAEPDLAALCEIFAIQGRAQALVADAFVDALAQDHVPETKIPGAVAQDNVIPFPVQALRA